MLFHKRTQDFKYRVRVIGKYAFSFRSCFIWNSSFSWRNWRWSYLKCIDIHNVTYQKKLNLLEISRSNFRFSGIESNNIEITNQDNSSSNIVAHTNSSFFDSIWSLLFQMLYVIKKLIQILTCISGKLIFA